MRQRQRRSRGVGTSGERRGVGSFALSTDEYCGRVVPTNHLLGANMKERINEQRGAAAGANEKQLKMGKKRALLVCRWRCITTAGISRAGASLWISRLCLSQSNRVLHVHDVETRHTHGTLTQH